jgi:hypothetical protein
MADHKQKKEAKGIKAFLNFLLSPLLTPLSIFTKKKFYALALIDLIFFVLLFFVGRFLDASSKSLKYESNIFTLLLLTFGVLFAVLALYSGAKYLFYRRIGSEVKFSTLLWRHPSAFALICLLILVFMYLFYTIIDFFILPAYAVSFKLVLRYFCYASLYLVFLNFHEYEREYGFFASIFKSFGSLFSKTTLKIILYDIILIGVGILVGYVLVNFAIFISWLLFKIFEMQIYGKLPTVSDTYIYINSVIMSITFISIITFNKILRYNVSLESKK